MMEKKLTQDNLNTLKAQKEASKEAPKEVSLEQKQDNRKIQNHSEFSEQVKMLYLLFPELSKVHPNELIKALNIAIKVYNLNPLKKECHFIPYWDKNLNRYTVQIVTSYLTYIERALSFGTVAGIEVYSKKEDDDIYAEAIVYRKDFTHPIRVRVYMSEFQKNTPIWKEKPRLMLEKVALARAFRLGFADVLSVLPYTKEELLGEAESDIIDIPVETLNEAIKNDT